MSFEPNLADVLPPYPEGAVPSEENEAARLEIGLARLDILERNDGDPNLGTFREQAAIRELHAWRSVGLGYGQLGLAEGALSPRHAIGTIEHTKDKDRWFTRVAVTGIFLEKLVFGSYEEGRKITDEMFKRHVPAKGEFSQAAGSQPAGTRYSAHDPDMMLWTLSSIDQPPRDIFEATVRSLHPIEHEAIWQDRLMVGRLSGLALKDAPKTYVEAKRYRQEQLAGDKLHPTPAGTAMGEQTCFKTPVHPLLVPVRELLVRPALRGLLSPEARAMYELQYGPLEQLTSKLAIKAIAVANRLLPEFVAKGSSQWFFDGVRGTDRKQKDQGTNYRVPDAYMQAA
jgi:uncharacterized protein (DUF2236 family)